MWAVAHAAGMRATEGNASLTRVIGAVLVVLLIAEGITIIRMGGLVSAHMFIGMVLIPPVLLKLGSTGYRFVRYYSGDRAYRAAGPPLLPLRLLAPVLVVTTVVVFVTGVWLLVLGHKSDTLLEVHKVAFIVWGVAFAIHVLAYIPAVVRSFRTDWLGPRALLAVGSVGGGAALAIALLAAINGWN